MTDHPSLTSMVDQAFGQTLRWLTSESLPDAFAPQVKRYANLRSELGIDGVCEAFSMQADELVLFNKIVADVNRRLKASEDAGRGVSDSATRNLRVSQLRLLSWIETLLQRHPGAEWSLDVESIVSEDLGRKRVRALELVVRSLVGERHASQEQLVSHLRELVGDRVVDKWLETADRDDVLSGTAFSELASLFVNRQEFASYEPLYDDTSFLTLLRDKRKTIQSFLEDIRRIRNAMAHNKRISNVQLALLDLYYDELMSPVEHSYEAGKTHVDPDQYLNVSDQALDDYFANLHDDVMSIKDDIADLKESVLQQLEVVSADTRQIKTTTRSMNRRLAWTVAAVLVAAIAGLYAVTQNWRTGETVQDLAETTQDVADQSQRIESTTQEIADRSARVEKHTADIRDQVGTLTQNSERVIESLDAIREGFQGLTKLGGIVPNPNTPQEVYHNARVYEQQGNYANARKSYVRFFAYDLDLVDPHLRFQSFLKLQEGRAGARETYHELVRRSKSFVTAYAATLLENPTKRVAQLTNFVANHPEFAPAFYELSREFSEARLGDQAASDKASELKYLQTFLALHEKGQFLKFLLDQELADQQLIDARSRLEALKVVDQESLTNPITLTATKNNAGWTVTVSVVGQVKEILFKKKGEAEFVSTGFRRETDPETGFPMPNTLIELDRNIGNTILLFQYRDTRDRVHGPFEVPFDPKAELFRSAKEMLGRLTNSWVMFRDYDGKTLLYFTQLLTQRHALAEIRYGVDVETPDKLYPIPPADPNKPWSIGKGLPFIEVPAATKFVTVQLKYTDGTTSSIHRLQR